MDEKQMVSLNMFKVDQAFQKALPGIEAKLAAKSAKVIPGSSGKTQEVMAEALGILGPIATAQLTFCAAWPKVRQMLNVALSFASWIPGYGPQIAMAKRFLTAFNDQIVPQICQPPK